MAGGTMAEQPTRKYDFDRVVRLVLGIAGVVALLWLMRFLADVLIPFAIAVLLAYLLNPVVGWIDRGIKRRTISVLITVIGAGVILLACVGVLIPILHGQISDAADMLSELRQDDTVPGAITPEAKTLAERYEEYYDGQSARVQVVLDRVYAVLTEADLNAIALSAARKLAPGVWGILTGALSLLLATVGLIVIVLYLIFLLIDYPRYSATWKELLPPRYRDPVVQFLEEFTVAMSRYFRGQALVAISVGILFTIGFSVIGLRMSLMLGLFIGALNMIPYLQIAGLVPALLLAVLRAVEHGGGLAESILLTLAVFAVVQAIQDGLLTPQIMGKATGLKPIWILLGVFIWGKLLGFLGVVLAIPLTCLGLAYYRRFILGRADDSP